MNAHALLERFRLTARQDIDLTLRPAYRALLAQLGHPERHLPPVIHVAGTNGKGSTCAFLRAILEAAGFKVHVYTSPHLVRFEERIRVAGSLISEQELTDILTLCEQAAEPKAITYFEAATAAAFVAFARHPADFTLLETGLGGRLDATNIVDQPLATVITRLSYDHRDYLGDTLDAIAREKAGIMKKNIPCFVAAQPSEEARRALRETAATLNVPLAMGDDAWHVTPTENGFQYRDADYRFDLPRPALLGDHQIKNAGLAIATALWAVPTLNARHLAQGLRNVAWPARLQRLPQKNIPSETELWLDGGHNDSAGEILAAQAAQWTHEDPKPLHLILGMLTTKQPDEFLAPLRPFIQGLATVNIPDEPLAFTASALAQKVERCGMGPVTAYETVSVALDALKGTAPQRILICGSLYLAGHVLRDQEAR